VDSGIPGAYTARPEVIEMAKPRVCILMPRDMTPNIIDATDMARLRAQFDVDPEMPEEITADVARRMMKNASGCITGWGTNSVPEDAVTGASGLKIIAHSAGSVKGLVPLVAWKRGVVVTTAAESIAIGVAEFTLGLMITAMKRVYDFRVDLARGGFEASAIKARITEFYRATIGVIGAGFVGQHTLRLLRNMPCTNLLYDPFVSEAKAKEMGAVKVTLEDLMRRSDVVTLHAPSIPETRHMIDARMLGLMRDGAILVNTARGAIIDEKAMIAELQKGRIFACLDVTDPEPAAADNPLRTLPNVVLTPHVAGAAANNRFRQGTYAVDELERVLLRREPPRFGISEEALARMA
jgi:phosphoglycerate dehydrogenase-like enzyme